MTDTSTGFGFADWFTPLDLAGFRDGVLGRAVLVTEPRPELAERLREALAIQSVEDLFVKRVRQVSAWLPLLDGTLGSAIIRPDSARTFYAAGTTLFYQDVAEFAPFAKEAADAFGVSAKSAKCQLFCNRPGSGTSVHFDPVDVITVQLTGCKTWRVAPNRFAPAPLEGWAPNDPVSAVMRIYGAGEPPSEIPGDATEYRLEPGAVLHVPRGYWHETSSDQESISLHILLIPPLRLDFLLASLRNELLREPYWRESVYDLDNTQWLTAAQDAFDDAVARISIQDLVRSPVPDLPVTPETTFVRAGQCALHVDTTRAETAGISVTAYGFRDTSTTTVQLDRGYLPACQWVNQLPTGVSLDVADVLGAAPELSKAEVQQLLGLFERARLVRRIR
ncbi:JmjC domain-containing protein [Nocardia pseudovaccinii]|uniref:JmjC domain-containing protein n=1 Tax=Nocardia pseudovaccinii TaxID=189540 RepID=UPI0007A40F01|nr:cupin domain-containing protein [Nocardia pseudovaccinii]